MDDESYFTFDGSDYAGNKTCSYKEGIHADPKLNLIDTPSFLRRHWMRNADQPCTL